MCQWLPSHLSDRVEKLGLAAVGCGRLNYLLSVALWKRFADLCSKVWELSFDFSLQFASHRTVVDCCFGDIIYKYNFLKLHLFSILGW